MQNLFHSTFLQALGYAIANSLWQTALVWLIYISLSSLISMSSAAKYRLAVAAQVTGFIWFIITFQFYYSQYNHALQQSLGGAPQAQPLLVTGTDLGSQLINWMVKGEQLLPYVSMAYLLLMLFLCVRWFLGYRQTQRIRSNGLQKMPVEWRLFVKRIAGQLNIKQTIRIYLSNTASSPLTIGFFKPVILIPVASINHLTTDQLEAVLLHELAHIKRYDYLVNIILSVVEISLFFNPFTQLLSKHIRKERENSCDDWVLQYQYDASTYAEALLRIAYLQATPAFAMAATGKKNELLVRVKRMIGEKDNRFSYRKQLLAFAIVTGILCSVAWLNPMSARKEQQDVAASNKLPHAKKYQAAPMAMTVDNPLFNPVFFLSEPLKEKMKKDIESAQKEIADNIESETSKEEFLPAMEPLITGALDQAATALSDKKQMETAMKNADMGRLMFEKFFKDSLQLLPRIREGLKTELAGVSLKKIEKEVIRAKEEAEKTLRSQKIPLTKETIRLSLAQAMEALDALNKNTGGLDKLVSTALKSLQSAENMDADAKELFKQLNIPSLPDDSKLRSKTPAAEKEILLPRKAETSIQENEDNGDDNNGEPKPEFIPLNELPEMLQLVKLDQVKLDQATLNQLKQILARRAAFLDAGKLRIVPAIMKEVDTVEGRRIVVKFQ